MTQSGDQAVERFGFQRSSGWREWFRFGFGYGWNCPNQDLLIRMRSSGEEGLGSLELSPQKTSNETGLVVLGLPLAMI